MTRNSGSKNSKKKVKNDKAKVEKTDAAEIKSIPVDGVTPSDFTLIPDNNTPTQPAPTKEVDDPIQAAIEILGCAIFAITIAGDLRKKVADEFYYYQYGVSLHFEYDDESQLYKVLNYKSKASSTAAAWWLIDKLAAETKGKLFYSPGREGIER